MVKISGTTWGWWEKYCWGMFCTSSLGELLRSYHACTSRHMPLHGARLVNTWEGWESCGLREGAEARVLGLCSVEHSLSRTYTKWVCHFKENKTRKWVKSLSLKLFLHRHYHKQEFLDPLHKGNVLGPPQKRVKRVLDIVLTLKEGWVMR